MLLLSSQANFGWLWSIFSGFWFWLDRSIYGLIGDLYNLLMTISRVSILSQAQIKDLSDRIQMMLGIFMLFKVSFSLITYIVNPDDFSDKSKGIGKLVLNTVISLTLLVIVPYIFNMAFRIQAKILEENVLAHLIFGDSDDYQFHVLNAGEQIKYEILIPFLQPNTGMGNMDGIEECAKLTENGKFNKKCYNALKKHIDETDQIHLENYKTGVEQKSFGLTFRLDTINLKISDAGDDSYAFDYRWPITTIVGVVVCLLLVNFCIDVAMRSIKLAFLQLVAPIPIISYMDPKSGKDGLFTKWYKMCLSTYVSLFVRLLALFLGVFMITNIDSLVDVISGSVVTDPIVKIFIIIGVLFFVRQLPKILQDLGIKLDGDGKFNLNPFKRMEEGMIGGKIASKLPTAATGAALGLGVGAVGTATGAGAGKWLTGMASGLTGGLKGKKIGEIHKDQVAANARMRDAIANGSTFWGRRREQFAGLTGSGGEAAAIERESKRLENAIKPLEEEEEAMNKVSSAKGEMKKRAKDQLYNSSFDTSKEGGKKYAEIQENLLKAKYLKEAQEETFKNQLEKGVDADGNAYTQERYSSDMAKATAIFNAAEDDALEKYADWSIKNSSAKGVDAAIVGIKDKTNATIKGSKVFEDNGITQISSFDDVKANDGKAQGRITQIETGTDKEPGLNKLRQQQRDLKNSERYAASQANKAATKK